MLVRFDKNILLMQYYVIKGYMEKQGNLKLKQNETEQEII